MTSIALRRPSETFQVPTTITLSFCDGFQLLEGLLRFRRMLLPQLSEDSPGAALLIRRQRRRQAAPGAKW